MWETLLATSLLIGQPLSVAPTPDPRALTAAVHDMCGKQVALLGEAQHGDGETIAFKVALVQRLVSECHYNAVFFESSHYDFIALNRVLRRGGPVSADMLSSSIGGLWNTSVEFAPLIPFLFEKARAGRVTLGGIDDNVGSAGAFFSLEAMPAELAGRLGGPRQAECREAMRRHIYFDYSDAIPHSDRTVSGLRRCLAEIAQAIGPGNDRDTSEQREMVDSFGRSVARDLHDDVTQTRARDRSMYLNFKWLAEGLPRGSKIIVWAATSHIARDASAHSRYAGGSNFGSYIAADYRRGAFALGFTAASGTYRATRRAPLQTLTAPAESLEAQAMRGGGGTTYLGRKALVRFGTVPAGPFFHEWMPLRWSILLDGLVVFREEQPPAQIR